MDVNLITLAEAWETLVVPQMDSVSDRTLSEYRDSLSIWTRLSGNPPACSISREVVRAFREKLLSTPYKRGKSKTGKRSPATVNRIMRDLHVVISPLWPADRVNPSGRGMIPFFAWPRSLCRQKKLPFVFTADNLDQLYLKANSYTAAPGCRTSTMNNPRLWRTALVLALNCGARTWDLFDLRWTDIRLDDPAPYQFGSIVFGARKTNKLHRIPLNQCAARHLNDLRKRPVTDRQPDRVFPGFYKGDTFYTAWKAICAAANVSGTFESMRKTAVTRHNSIIWNSGFWLSGHVEPGVFGHYDNPSDRIFEAVYKLENPPEFVRGMHQLESA